MGDVMELLHPCLPKLGQKVRHVSVQGFLLKEVLESEAAPFLDHPQGFPYHLTLVRLGADLMEDKVADGGLEGFVGEGQVGGVPLLEANPVGDPFGGGVLLAELLCAEGYILPR